jgi:hypothetical protein
VVLFNYPNCSSQIWKQEALFVKKKKEGKFFKKEISLFMMDTKIYTGV